MKQRTSRIMWKLHGVLRTLLWVVGGSVMLPVPVQAVPACSSAAVAGAAWPRACYQQDGANTLQWMPLLAAQGDEPVLKAITNAGDAANNNDSDVYNTNGYRLPNVQELALLLGFDENNTEYNAFATVPYMHAWFNLPDTGVNPVARRLLSATNNRNENRLMMSLANGAVTPVVISTAGDIPGDEPTTVAILVRNFPAQFRIGSSGNCLKANNDKTISSVLCSGANDQLWRYHIASGCLHSAAEQDNADKCLGQTAFGNVKLTGVGDVFFVGQHIKLGSRYLSEDAGAVTWESNQNAATSFTLLPP